VVIGLILGPIEESQLRRALAISLADPMALLQGSKAGSASVGSDSPTNTCRRLAVERHHPSDRRTPHGLIRGH
jgi:hypothetical protein